MKPAHYAGRVQHATRLKHRHPVLQVFLAVLLSVCLFTATAGALVYKDLSGQVKTATQAEVLLSRTPEPNDDYSGRALNILVIGSDSRSDGNDSASLTNNDDTTQRSDTTMLMHISADRSRIQVVSIPRDLLVSIPACQRSDGSSSAEQSSAQFNWAFSIGGGDRNDLDGAIACTWKTMERLSGITVDEAIVVDFNGFISMIDALGGINVYVASAISDAANTGLVTEAGCKHFDGQQALQYARVRHGVSGGDGSDLQRITRQQEVVGIMIRSALRKNLLTSVTELYSFVRAGLNSLTVSSGLSSMSSLSGLAWSLRSIDPSQIQFVNLPTRTATSDKNRLEVIDSLAASLWEALANDQLLPAGLEVKDGNGNTYTTEETLPTSDTSTTVLPTEGANSSTSSPAATSSAETSSSESSETSSEKSEAEILEELQIQCETSG